MTSFVPLILGLVASLMTYAGGLLTISLSRHRELIFGLTAGLMIGLALLDLLPEAVRLGGAAGYGPAVFVATAGGVAVYYLLHRISGGALFGRLTVLLHSFIDGLGIGLAFQVSTSIGWGVAAAVLAHKLADGANMVGITLTAGIRNAHRWLIVNAVAPLVGVACAGHVVLGGGSFALILAIFAGGFLYIAAGELLPRSRIAFTRTGGAMASLAGVAIMAGITHLSH